MSAATSNSLVAYMRCLVFLSNIDICLLTLYCAYLYTGILIYFFFTIPYTVYFEGAPFCILFLPYL